MIRLAMCMMVISLWASDWSFPIDISSPSSGLASNPHVVLDDSNNGFAVWKQVVDTDYSVQAASLSWRALWGSPVTLTTAADVDFANSRMAILGSISNVFAVWVEEIAGRPFVRSAHTTTPRTWTVVSTLSADLDGTISEARVAVNAIGHAVAVWVKAKGGNNIVQASYYSGNSWSAPFDLSASGQDASSPAVVLGAADQALVAWTRSNGSNTIVQMVTFQLGETASSVVNLSTPGQNATSPQIVGSGIGYRIIAWNRSDGANTIVQAITYRPGGTLTSVCDLSPAGQNAALAQVVMNSSDQVAAIWRLGSGVIQSSTLDFMGGLWSSPLQVSVTSAAGTTPRIGIDQNGNLLAIWSQLVSSRQVVYWAMKTPNQVEWSCPLALSSSALDTRDPRMTINSQGNAIVAWTRLASDSLSVIQATSGSLSGLLAD